MEVKTELGKTYTVVSTAGGSVTTQDGTPVKTLTAGQDYFTAVSSVTVIADDEAIVQEVFKSAPIGGSGGGGGATITFDDTPTKGSTNAVTSGGIYTAMLHSDGAGGIKIGQNPSTSNTNNVAIGHNATAEGNALAVGNDAKAGMSSAAILGKAEAFGCVAIGPARAGKLSIAIGYDSFSQEQGAVSVGFNCANAGIFSTAIGHSVKTYKNYSTALGYSANTNAAYSTALGCYANNSTANSIVLSAHSSANTKFVLTLVAGTATGDAGSILSDTPFVTGSTLKLTVSDGVSGISETLSIDAAALFTLLQTAGGTVTLTNPNA